MSLLQSNTRKLNQCLTRSFQGFKIYHRALGKKPHLRLNCLYTGHFHCILYPIPHQTCLILYLSQAKLPKSPAQ